MNLIEKRIQAVRIDFRDQKTPYSQQFQDIYFSTSTGVEESSYVYLEGSGFIHSLEKKKPKISVGEIGFGVGLNFILTLKKFIEESSDDQQLTYYSFEKFPVVKEDLDQLYGAYPDLKPTADLLLFQYPVLTPGVHLLTFLDGRVRLYLGLGDAKALLPQLEFTVDHWYWDGFAPSRNPDAFSEELFQEIALHSNHHTQGASFTAAGWVRRSLEQLSFHVEKRPGFGKKRECITAIFQGSQKPSRTLPWFSHQELKLAHPDAGPIAIIGSGLAGSAIAQSLARRGFRIQVYDPHGIANRASSNSAALFNTQLSKLPNPISRFSQASLVHFLSELEHLHIPCKRGILRTDHTETSPLLNSDYPESFYRLEERGIYFPDCGMLNPRELCKKRLLHHLISVIPERVTEVKKRGEHFELVLQSGKTTEPVAHVIYALGADPKLSDQVKLNHSLLDALPTRPIRGQTVLIKSNPLSETLKTVLVEEGYASPIAPEITGHSHHLLGATYQAKGITEDQEHRDSEKLISEAKRWAELSKVEMKDLVSSKVGYRLSTPDKLPLIGPLCDPEVLKSTYAHAFRGSRVADLPALPVCRGEWLLTGLGSRGVTYSSLAAEILAALMTGDTLPIEMDLFEHLHSARFFIRNLKKPELNSSP